MTDRWDAPESPTVRLEGWRRQIAEDDRTLFVCADATPEEIALATAAPALRREIERLADDLDGSAHVAETVAAAEEGWDRALNEVTARALRWVASDLRELLQSEERRPYPPLSPINLADPEQDPPNGEPMTQDRSTPLESVVEDRAERRCAKCGRVHVQGPPDDGFAGSWADPTDGHPYYRESWEAVANRLAARLEALSTQPHQDKTP